MVEEVAIHGGVHPLLAGVSPRHRQALMLIGDRCALDHARSTPDDDESIPASQSFARSARRSVAFGATPSGILTRPAPCG